MTALLVSQKNKKFRPDTNAQVTTNVFDEPKGRQWVYDMKG